MGPAYYGVWKWVFPKPYERRSGGASSQDWLKGDIRIIPFLPSQFGVGIVLPDDR